MSFDPEKFGRAVGEQIKSAVAPLQKEIAELRAENAAIKLQLAELKSPPEVDPIDLEAIAQKAAALIPAPEKGEKGLDGIGMAGALIDRDGCLQITLTSGEVKNLGKVEGKNGEDGTSLESFTMEYIEETHEVCIKGSCGNRTQEIRYPAGGIQPGGYWRDGTKAKACEAWVQDGSLWIAKRDTTAKPESKSEDWVLAARKGRDTDPNTPAPAGTIKVGPGSK